MSDNNTFFARWSWADNIRTSPQSFPGREVEMFNKFRNMAISDTHIFNATTIFEFKFGYNSDNIQRRTEPLNLGVLINDLPATFRDDFDFPVNIAMAGFAGAGLTAFVSGPQKTYQFLPSLSKISGNHTFKIGVDLKVRHILHDGVFANVSHDRLPTSDPQDATGTTGFSYASFLLGAPVGPGPHSTLGGAGMLLLRRSQHEAEHDPHLCAGTIGRSLAIQRSTSACAMSGRPG